MSLIIQLFVVASMAVAFQCAPAEEPSSTTPKISGIQPLPAILLQKNNTEDKSSESAEDSRITRDTNQQPQNVQHPPVVGLADPNKYPKPLTQPLQHPGGHPNVGLSNKQQGNNRERRETPQTGAVPQSSGPQTRPRVGLADPSKYPAKAQTAHPQIRGTRETPTSTTGRTTPVHAVPLPALIKPTQNQQTKDVPKSERIVRDTDEKKPAQVATLEGKASLGSSTTQQTPQHLNAQKPQPYRNYST